jgi:hypothetical protein
MDVMGETPEEYCRSLEEECTECHLCQEDDCNEWRKGMKKTNEDEYEYEYEIKWLSFKARKRENPLLFSQIPNKYQIKYFIF